MAVAIEHTLESLAPGAIVHGVLPDAPVEVVQVAWQIATALGVTAGRVSAHLSRGKATRFEGRPDGWHVREER
jgi:hypothetical protein